MNRAVRCFGERGQARCERQDCRSERLYRGEARMIGMPGKCIAQCSEMPVEVVHAEPCVDELVVEVGKRRMKASEQSAGLTRVIRVGQALIRLARHECE